MTWSIGEYIWPKSLICAGCFHWEKIKGHCNAPISIWGRCDLYHYYEFDKMIVERVTKHFWIDVERYETETREPLEFIPREILEALKQGK